MPVKGSKNLQDLSGSKFFTIPQLDGKVYKVYAIPSWQKFYDALDCVLGAQ